MDDKEIISGREPDCWNNENDMLDLQFEKAVNSFHSNEKYERSDLSRHKLTLPSMSTGKRYMPDISFNNLEKTDQSENLIHSNGTNDGTDFSCDTICVICEQDEFEITDISSGRHCLSERSCDRPNSLVESSKNPNILDLGDHDPSCKTKIFNEANDKSPKTSEKLYSCDILGDATNVSSEKPGSFENTSNNTEVSREKPEIHDISSNATPEKPESHEISHDITEVLKDKTETREVSSDTLKVSSDGEKVDNDSSTVNQGMSDISSSDADTSSTCTGSTDTLSVQPDIIGQVMENIPQYSSSPHNEPGSLNAKIDISSDRSGTSDLVIHENGDPDNLINGSHTSAIKNSEKLVNCPDILEVSCGNSHITDKLVRKIPVISNNLLEINILRNDSVGSERAKEVIGVNGSTSTSKTSPDCSKTNSAGCTKDQQLSCEKTTNLELCITRLLAKSDVINTIKSVTINTEKSEILLKVLNPNEDTLLHETSNQSTKPFVNESEVTVIADGKWKISKGHRSSNVCVLKCLDEDTQSKFKCIYFNRGTKLDELFKSRTEDEFNVSHEEIFDCIDSIKVGQLDRIEDHAEPNPSGFLETRMGTSMEISEEDLIDDNDVDIQNSAIEIANLFIKDLFDKIDSMAEDKNTFYEISAKSQIPEDDEIEDVCASVYDENQYSNKLITPFKNVNSGKCTGSKVQDVSGNISLNESKVDSTTQTTQSDNQVNRFSIQQTLFSCAQILFQSVFGVICDVYHLFSSRKTPPISEDCSTTQTNVVSVDNDCQLGVDTIISPSTSSTKLTSIPRPSLKYRSRIGNLATLFQHLCATAGTDMTAERVKKNINSQVVMDLYNGFHELRVVDYGSLDLMSKCIRGSIDTLEKTLCRSKAIVQKSTGLLHAKTHTLEDMQKLNQDLKELTSDAELHLHDVDRALSRLEDFTEDFMYYKNAISKELIEFLLEDFPEIFK